MPRCGNGVILVLELLIEQTNPADPVAPMNYRSQPIRSAFARPLLVLAAVLALSGCGEEPAQQQQNTAAPASPVIDGSAESLKNAYDTYGGNNAPAKTEAVSEQPQPTELPKSDAAVSYGSATGSEVGRTTQVKADLSKMVENLSANMSGEDSVRFLAEQRKWESQNFGCPTDTTDVGHHSCMQFHILSRMQEIKGRYQEASTGQIQVN